MTYSAECECDKCHEQINANSEVFCFWCLEDLRIKIDELKEIIRMLEKKDSVKCGR